MSRMERNERGLLHNPDALRLTARAQRAEKNLGGASFQTWITGAPATRVRQAIAARGASWQRVHDALTEFGCAIEPKGSGLVVTTTLSNGRVLAAKASLMGRWASKAALERTLGGFEAPTQSPRHRNDSRKETYEKSMARERLKDTGPRWGGNDPERLARRAARADAREELAQRFEQEQGQRRAERAREREALRARHQRERRTLVDAHRDQRRRARAGASTHGTRGRAALSIWAFEAAAEREVLQRRHAMERRALTDRLPRSEVWRLWLERQALAGDEAAKSALRGIRYREQRKCTRVDAIEGEEITDPRPLIVGSLRAEVDAARLVVIYRRVDGAEAFRDTGPRIVMHDKSDESLGRPACGGAEVRRPRSDDGQRHVSRASREDGYPLRDRRAQYGSASDRRQRAAPSP